MGAAECSAFMAFLQHIPPPWISRRRASPGQDGWAPFRGPLRHQSQKQAVTIIASLYAWLQAAQYLGANPWLLVNQKKGDERARCSTRRSSSREQPAAAQKDRVHRPSPGSSGKLWQKLLIKVMSKN